MAFLLLKRWPAELNRFRLGVIRPSHASNQSIAVGENRLLTFFSPFLDGHRMHNPSE